jgi:hypothetical protein
MKTVTIKSSSDNNNNQFKDVVFLDNGVPTATRSVPYNEGYEWAAEYASRWCEYGLLPIGAAPTALPDPPAEIHLPETLTLQELHDLLCEHPHSFIGSDPITEFELHYDGLDNPDVLQVDMYSWGHYLLQGSSERVGNTVICYTCKGTLLQIDLTFNPTA